MLADASQEAKGQAPEPYRQSTAFIRVLIVDDDPDDREIVADYLRQDTALSYVIQTSTCLGEALDKLKSSQIDVVLQDLDMPDANKYASVRDVRTIRPDVAIVCVSGITEIDAEESSLAAGANDFIAKNELNPLHLSRSIGYALYWTRAQQLNELSETVTAYRGLSSVGAGTSLASQMVGLGPLKKRQAFLFNKLLVNYRVMARTYFHYLAVCQGKPAEEMSNIVVSLGTQNAGPRDLMDLHSAVIEDEMDSHRKGAATRALAGESRLLALEMMGLLVNYYRNLAYNL